MTTRYSASTGCFYPKDIDYGSLPADLIEVSQEDFDTAMARPDGSTFTFVGGALVITAPAAAQFSDEAAAYMVEVRATRERIFAILMGIAAEQIILGNTANAQAIPPLCQALRNLPQHATVVEAMDIESLRAAVKAVYKSISNTAPEWLRTAFNGMAT